MAYLRNNPIGLDVATYLGRQADTGFVAQCGVIVTLTYSAAASYTRDNGFDNPAMVPDDIYAAIISRAARLANNPLSLNVDSVDSTTMQDNFAADWNMGERRILNRYRQKVI